MTELLTAAQMRAIEQAAIESDEVTGLELMERAGRGVVEAVFEEWPELAKAPHRAVVLCGPGNNGGDGFVIARLLKDWGWEVEVFLYGDPEKLPPDAKVNYERWGALGEVANLVEQEDEHDFVAGVDLAVDALFGTGLGRGVEKDLGRFISVLNFHDSESAGVRTVAVDIPSGICSDSGKSLGGVAVAADLTVSFHAAKLGHYLADGPAEVGAVITKCIGLIPRSIEAANKQSRMLRRAFPKSGSKLIAIARVQCDWQDPLRKRISHKYTHGHALILSGGMGRTGAARLAARASLRIGAGLVTVAAPGSAMMECASQLTAVMLRKCDGAEGLAALLEDDRLNAICLGPGLGIERARELVPGALASKQRSVVLDADALMAFEDDPNVLFGMLHDRCVLTPHAGEFRRLFSDLADKLEAPAIKGPAYSKVDATREAAARAGCVVLFKGPDTVIAAPDGRCAINSAHYDRATPWLATAGSGDVLAGFITGLLARGFGPMQAAETAAWLHVECARSFGPGLIAEDLPEELPKVFRELGL